MTNFILCLFYHNKKTENQRFSQAQRMSYNNRFFFLENLKDTEKYGGKGSHKSPMKFAF